MVYRLHDACRKAADVMVLHNQAVPLLPMHKCTLYQADPDHSTIGCMPYVVLSCMPGRDRLVSSSTNVELQRNMAAVMSDMVACCLNGTFICFFSLHLAVYTSEMCKIKHIPMTNAHANMSFAAFLRRRGYQYSGSRGACCSLMLPPLPSPLSCSAFPSHSQRLWCGLSCRTSQLAWLVNLAGQLMQCSPPCHS